MIKTKKELKQAIEAAGEQWHDLLITSTEMREQIRAAKEEYKTFIKRNK